jgi:hypothetical protein
MALIISQMEVAGGGERPTCLPSFVFGLGRLFLGLFSVDRPRINWILSLQMI